jgi:hypothetical protein
MKILILLPLSILLIFYVAGIVTCAFGIWLGVNDELHNVANNKRKSPFSKASETQGRKYIGFKMLLL